MFRDELIQSFNLLQVIMADPTGLLRKDFGDRRCLTHQFVRQRVADPTGFEPAITCVTGKYVRPLHHGSTIKKNFLTLLD